MLINNSKQQAAQRRAVAAPLHVHNHNNNNNMNNIHNIHNNNNHKNELFRRQQQVLLYNHNRAVRGRARGGGGEEELERGLHQLRPRLEPAAKEAHLLF
jgi:hypothetical protein